ncbi:MAG: alpha/beta hydrolase [Cyanobacteria bacterium J06633_2]
MPLPVRNNRVRLPQGPLFWREIGEGDVLVFLHGAWATGEQWLDVVHQLGQTYQCFAPDLLGFGESTRRIKHYSVQLEVEGLADYLKLLRIKRCVLIGYGLGAWVASAYALAYPDSVRGLIAASPEGVMLEKLNGRWRGWPLLSSPIPFVGWALRLWAGVTGLFGRGRSPRTSLRLRRMLRQSPAACQLLFRRRRAERQSEYLHDRISELQCPMLVLQSETDPADLIAMAQVYAQAPRAELNVLPAIGVPEPWKLSKEAAATLQIDDAIASVIQTFVEQHCRD